MKPQKIRINRRRGLRQSVRDPNAIQVRFQVRSKGVIQVNEGTVMKPYVGTEPYLFFSYARGEGANVPLSYIASVQNDGFRLRWDDARGSDAPTDPETLQNDIEHCSAFLAFVDQRYVDSEICAVEWRIAEEAGKPIIPILPDPEKLVLRNGYKVKVYAKNYIERRTDAPILSLLDTLSKITACAAAKGTPRKVERPVRIEYRLGTSLRFALKEDGSSYEVTGLGSCDSSAVEVPETHRGLPVTEIGPSAFSQGGGLWTFLEKALNKTAIAARVRIPKTVRTVHPDAFDQPTLLSIEIDPANPYLALKDAHLYSKDESVFLRFFSAFDKCAEFTLPETVREIDIGAFSGVTSLTKITLSAELRRIEASAFRSMSSLKEIDLPQSLTALGARSFAYCTALREVTVPESVREIGNWAFLGCTELTKIDLPARVDSLGLYGTFSDCTSLSSVTIPEGTACIGNYAFANCTSLTRVTVPDGTAALLHSAFSGCTFLKALSLPASITSIGNWVLNECMELKEIEFRGTVAEWKRIRFDERWYEGASVTAVRCTDGTVDL